MGYMQSGISGMGSLGIRPVWNKESWLRRSNVSRLQTDEVSLPIARHGDQAVREFPFPRTTTTADRVAVTGRIIDYPAGPTPMVKPGKRLRRRRKYITRSGMPKRNTQIKVVRGGDPATKRYFGDWSIDSTGMSIASKGIPSNVVPSRDGMKFVGGRSLPGGLAGLSAARGDFDVKVARQPYAGPMYGEGPVGMPAERIDRLNAAGLQIRPAGPTLPRPSGTIAVILDRLKQAGILEIDPVQVETVEEAAGIAPTGGLPTWLPVVAAVAALGFLMSGTKTKKRRRRRRR